MNSGVLPVTILPLSGLPEVREGDDLAALLLVAMAAYGGLREGDVLVVASKVVSKALGLRASAAAGRDTEVLRQSRRVVTERVTPDGITRIVESLAGPVLTGAGIDASNTGADARLLVLPKDPDAAARDIHQALAAQVGLPGDPARWAAPVSGAPVSFAVVLSDTAGRPWRVGQTDFALGAYGLTVTDDLRGSSDADGRDLAVTERAVADEIAAAADLVKGKTSGVAAALLRGLGHLTRAASARPAAAPGQRREGARGLVRTGVGDWFALGSYEAVRAALGAPPGSAEAAGIGIPAAGPEPEADRAARAVRLALLGHPGVAVDGQSSDGKCGQEYVVRSADPIQAGRVAARLQAALAAEQLTAPVQVLPPSSDTSPAPSGPSS